MTLDEALSLGRHAVSYGMGLATAFGVVAIQGVDLSVVSTSVEHIFTGIKEISVGLAPLVAIAVAWWAKKKVSPEAQIAAVDAMPEIRAVIVKPTAPKDSPAAKAAADPSQPKVTVAGAAPVAASRELT